MAEETKVKTNKKDLSPAFLEGQNNAGKNRENYNNPYHPSTKKFSEYSHGWEVETLSQNENKLAISTNTDLSIEERQEAFNFLQSESTFDNVAGKAYFRTKEGRVELGIRPDKELSEYKNTDEEYRKNLIIKLNEAGIKENDKMISFFSNNKNSYNYIVDSENSNVLKVGINQDRALDAYKNLKDKSDAYIKFTDFDDNVVSYIVKPRDFKKNLGNSLSEDSKDINNKVLNAIEKKLLKEALTEEQKDIVMDRIKENAEGKREKSIQKSERYER